MGNYSSDRNDCRIFSMNNISFFSRELNLNKNPLSIINFNGQLQDRKRKIIRIHYYHYYAYICTPKSKNSRESESKNDIHV